MSEPRAARKSVTHVLHVIGALNTGGAEKMLINFLAAADKESYRHTVMCLTSRGDMAGLVEELGIPVIVFPVRMRRFPLDVVRLALWMKRQGVGIVHSHMFFASFWARLAGLRAGVPVLMTTEHGKEPWKKPWQSRTDSWLSRRTWHHIAVSEDVRNIRIARDRIDPSCVSVIPNGVPIPDPVQVAGKRSALRAELGLPSDGPVIGSVGRIIEAKAYPDLLAALGVARRTFPDLRWLQVGDGPDGMKLRREAERFSLADAIVFAGRRADVGDLLGTMDVWVMSSIREGLPVALLEAMAAGLAIVATNVGGIPDAVDDGVEAMLVPSGQPSILGEAIVGLLSDPVRAGALAEAARRRAIVDYGIEAVARRIEALYLAGIESAPVRTSNAGT